MSGFLFGQQRERNKIADFPLREEDGFQVAGEVPVQRGRPGLGGVCGGKGGSSAYLLGKECAVQDVLSNLNSQATFFPLQEASGNLQSM